MISTTAKYALSIIGYLAARRGSRIPGEQIARDTGIPANYLSKILNQLRKQAIVDAEKGWGGGFELRKDALGRPILDVVSVIDGARSRDKRTMCLFGLRECSCENPCSLHPYWERIRTIEDEMLSKMTVADLASP